MEALFSCEPLLAQCTYLSLEIGGPLVDKLIMPIIFLKSIDVGAPIVYVADFYLIVSVNLF